eukprot:1853215-Rhodomonas_salina.3
MSLAADGSSGPGCVATSGWCLLRPRYTTWHVCDSGLGASACACYKRRLLDGTRLAAFSKAFYGNKPYWQPMINARHHAGEANDVCCWTALITCDTAD